MPRARRRVSHQWEVDGRAAPLKILVSPVEECPVWWATYRETHGPLPSIRADKRMWLRRPVRREMVFALRRRGKNDLHLALQRRDPQRTTGRRAASRRRGDRHVDDPIELPLPVPRRPDLRRKLLDEWPSPRPLWDETWQLRVPFDARLGQEWGRLSPRHPHVDWERAL